MAATETPDSKKSNLVRRTYLIDRGFQLKYTVSLVVAGAVISILFGSLAYLADVDVQRNLADELIRAGGGADPSVVARLMKESASTLLVLISGVALVMGLALGLVGVLITHRVAGPIYVISNYMLALSEGRYPNFRPLRKNDELKTFFDRFRSAVEAMRRRELDEVAMIAECVDRLRATGSGGQIKEIAAALASVVERKRAFTGQPEAIAEEEEPRFDRVKIA
ncbi:MAG TPA: signal protein [Myxococcaceae bacterium]|nr:signal protein [Myxococcaceae bacterium]